MLSNEFPQDLLTVPDIFLAEGLDGQHAMSSPYSFILSSCFGYGDICSFESEDS